MSTTSEGGGESAPSAAAVVPAGLPPSIGLQGAVATFDPTQDDWCEYVERLEHYFTANDIVSVEKRRSILLYAVGASTYRLIRTLVSPAKVSEVSFADIVDLAKTHFCPKPSPIVKRFEFNTRCQREGESISVYVAELRKLAEHCEYGTTLSDMLRDRIVCGISDRTVQRRLLQQHDLTFDKALEIALASEAADKDSKRLNLSSASDKDNQISKVKDVPPPSPPPRKGDHNPKCGKPSRSGKRQPAAGTKSKQDCSRCGGEHGQANCPYKKYECNYCKKKGHLARKCRKKSRDSHVETHRVAEDTPQDDEFYRMDHVSSGSTAPLYATVTINGSPLSMEIDTGASVTIASLETFNAIREGESSLELTQSNVKLQTYTGEPIEVCGATQVQVKHNEQTLTLPLLVTKGDGPTLLGRNWLEALRLDWRTIFHVGSNRTLQQVLDRHRDVFKEELGELRGTAAKIHIERDAQPRFEKARPVPFAIRKKVEQELERLQALGVIRPVQFSDWAAPIVPVMKPDGKVRICGDYKVTINRAAKVERYPIPRIEELFASLSGGQRFTKLDLSHAYLQIPLDTPSRRLVTINTHKGLFEYTRLPFGIASAPSIFQRTMENLLQGIPRVCVYLDDILVTGMTEQEHLTNLEQVLQRLESAGMKLKRPKCAFLLESVSYLGHVISKEGLRTAESKVKAIVDAPDPKNLAELRSFLGMVNYYSKFLPNIAAKLSPLYRLLRQSEGWQWGSQQRKAFRHVKGLLKSNRVLTHYNDQLPLLLECDASPYGLGAILSHRMPDGSEKPVGFASRTLSKAECNYSHLDKEALAIIFGVKKYHQYLYGRHFEIKTDHKPLTHLFNETKAVPTMASSRIQRWALLLSAYDYSVHYKQGKENTNVDALSRLPLPSQSSGTPIPAEVVHLMEHLATTPLSSSQIQRWTDQDLTLSKVKSWVQEGWPDNPELDQELAPYNQRRLELGVEGGCVLWGCRVVVPPRGRKQALQMLHESHPGIARMKALARSYMWWPGMDKEIEHYVKECSDCQSTQKEPPSVPLHPWTWPERPWSRVHIDYAGPLEGKMFLLIMDAHSRWMEIHVTNTASSMATIELLRRSFATLGLPEVVVSDNGTAFTSLEFSEFMKRNGIRHVRTPPYHPASNGLVERAVQTFKEGFKRLQKGSINTRVTRFLFKYRLTPHSSTGLSPAELMFGRKLRSQLDQIKPSLQRQAHKSQDQQRKSHDKRSKARSFTQDEQVYVRNYGPGPKWLPGVVVKLQGSVLLEVRLEDGRIVRRHVDQLRSRVGVSLESPPSDGVDLPSQPDQEVRNDEILTEPGSTDPEPLTSETTASTRPPPEPAIQDEISEPVGAGGLIPDDNRSQEPASESADAEGLSPSTDEAGSRQVTVRRSGRARNPPMRYEGQFS